MSAGKLMDVAWTARGQAGQLAGWAGNGTGEVLQYSPQRDGFANGAMLVRFHVARDGRSPMPFDAWIDPAELDQIRTEAA